VVIVVLPMVTTVVKGRKHYKEHIGVCHRSWARSKSRLDKADKSGRHTDENIRCSHMQPHVP
jgi:hypothetical protein